MVAGRLRRGPVLRVQALDAIAGELEQGFVLGQRLGGRIREVGQQAEVQVVVPVGEEADFQRLDQALDVRRASQHRRHDHQRPRLRRQTPLKGHSRQRAGRDEQRRKPVHHVRCELAGGKQQEDGKCHQRCIRDTVGMGDRREDRGEAARDCRDRAEIRQQRDTPCEPAQDLGGARPRLHRPFES